jgi:hypothetical protein
MYETLTAFFLEAGFIGIVLFGEGRVSRAAHFFVCCMVSLGTLLSAGLILATSSWMQTPAGATMDAQGIFHVDSWRHGIFTASYPYRVMHMVCASFLTGAFLAAGVGLQLRGASAGGEEGLLDGDVGRAGAGAAADRAGRHARAEHAAAPAGQGRGNGRTLADPGERAGIVATPCAFFLLVLIPQIG